MVNSIQISDAEMRVMETIWESGTMMTVPEIVEKLKNNGEEWAYQTVATFLKRLEEKGILGSGKTGRKLSYYPLISKAQYQKQEARNFVSSKFNGSLKNFLAAFQGSNEWKDSEIRELKEWLDEFSN